MNMNEMIRSKLEDLIPNDLLRTIDNTVQKYENQKLASTESDGKKVWMVLGTAEVITWLPASDRDELLEIVQGIRVDPNSVEWRIEDYEGVELYLALADTARRMSSTSSPSRVSLISSNRDQCGGSCLAHRNQSRLVETLRRSLRAEQWATEKDEHGSVDNRCR